MGVVALYRCEDYSSENLGSLVESALSLGNFSRGQKVLVKANMLAARPPERCVTSHPRLVELICRGLSDLGCRPTIGDSPGIEPFGRVAKVSGLAEVGQRLGVAVEELADSRVCPPSTRRVHKRLELARQALEADAIVNVPKLKTHCQMQLTLAVKNLFGTVVGPRKAQWHYAVGLDRRRFADLLLDILVSLPPVLSILDGVWGMEGHGPSNGTIRRFGMVAASADALALDATVAAMVGLPGRRFSLIDAAARRGLEGWDLKGVDFQGDLSPQERFPAVKIPELDALNLLPSWLDGLGRHLLASRPVQDRDRCVACGRCAQVCPASALVLEGRRLRFDYRRCIRCYCCHEMCPADAIAFRDGVLTDLVSRLRDRIFH